ncbi:ankyrin repeat-containing protein At5g02620-like [Carya illinoinensis]|uniref:PGG domain-containing protein n=1 Tax=Carya illinoinensis TaxID=32201 RepID=A0A8T1PY40_CARIL|nr:ankyrin repeat-containing protein At5g02620-like [Carya illinoinensis]KAG6645200.1 hypothetical protein CIPAW_08G106100 [Carya illinoinensis]
MELSSSFEANAGSNINRAEHTDQAIPGMDPKFYEAAAKGNNGVFENISDPLDRFLTVNKNTILHICISSIHVEEDLAGGTDPASAEKFVKYVHDKCPSTLSLKANAEEETALAEERTSVVGGTDLASAEIFVKYVLDKCPSLSLKANAEEETALHIAARYGHVSIVEVLIEHEKSQLQDLERGVAVESSTATEMLIGRVNKEKDTALHEAVRNNHVKVVKLLLEIGPEFSYGANAAGETPLYLAAERHFPDLVFEILQTKSPAYDGPLGRTALHAAAFYDGEEITKNILERYGDLRKQADQNGWTPLHVAAYMNRIEPTQLLLKRDRGLAYIKDVEGKTALHIAARRNNSRIMEKIISMCPDCCELVDKKGCNALHDLAAANGRLGESTVEMILKYRSLRSLLNQKDADGNTPLHRHCNSWLMSSPGVDKRLFNKENLSAYQTSLTSENLLTDDEKNRIFKSACSEESRFCLSRRVLEIDYDESERKKQLQREKEKQEMEKQEKEKQEKQEKEKQNKENLDEFDKLSQAHLLVAALITTVTFAAGITMPGGFVGAGDNKPYPGSAVLWNDWHLKLFIACDSISMLLSTYTVIIYLVCSSKGLHSINPKTRKRFIRWAFFALYVAALFMVAAFFAAIMMMRPHRKGRRPFG